MTKCIFGLNYRPDFRPQICSCKFLKLAQKLVSNWDRGRVTVAISLRPTASLASKGDWALQPKKTVSKFWDRPGPTVAKLETEFNHLVSTGDQKLLRSPKIIIFLLIFPFAFISYSPAISISRSLALYLALQEKSLAPSPFPQSNFTGTSTSGQPLSLRGWQHSVLCLLLVPRVQNHYVGDGVVIPLWWHDRRRSKAAFTDVKFSSLMWPFLSTPTTQLPPQCL